MKKLSYLLALLIIIGIFSCKEIHDSEKNINNKYEVKIQDSLLISTIKEYIIEQTTKDTMMLNDFIFIITTYLSFDKTIYYISYSPRYIIKKDKNSIPDFYSYINDNIILLYCSKIRYSENPLFYKEDILDELVKRDSNMFLGKKVWCESQGIKFTRSNFSGEVKVETCNSIEDANLIFTDEHNLQTAL